MYAPNASGAALSVCAKKKKKNKQVGEEVGVWGEGLAGFVDDVLAPLVHLPTLVSGKRRIEGSEHRSHVTASPVNHPYGVDFCYFASE